MLGIIRLKSHASEFEEQVKAFNDSMYYKFISLDNFYIIESDNLNKYSAYKYISYIEEDSFASLSNLQFTPSITPNTLRQSSCLGWRVNVAVIDSGYNREKDNEFDCNFVDCFCAKTTDYINHGTVVSEIIKHFAPACNIITLKVTDDSEYVNKTRIAMALDYIYSQKEAFDIVNMSLGFHRFCDSKNCPVCLLVEQLDLSGVLVVAAAGNNDKIKTSICCFANSSHALTVGGLDIDNNSVATYSRAGIGTKKPDLIAPARVQIRLTDKNEPLSMDGTSFSAPIIAGISASIMPRLNKSNKIVKDIIKKSTVRLDNTHVSSQGYGKISTAKLQEVLDNEFNNKNIEQPSSGELN